MSSTKRSPETQPGRLIGRGLDADVFEFGRYALLRKPRSGRDATQERAIMRYVREAGIPVPRVFDYDDPTAILMERVDGPLMRADLSRRPWLLSHHARSLADLACRLGEVLAPSWLSLHQGSGDRVVHLDLNPSNIIISERGPVIIDWGNARRGGRSLDASYTWLCWKASPFAGNAAARALKRAARRVFLGVFEEQVGFAEILAHLPEAARFRFADRSLSADELELTEALLRKVAACSGQATRSALERAIARPRPALRAPEAGTAVFE